MQIAKLVAMGVVAVALSMPVFGKDLDAGTIAFQSGRYSEALKILLPLANAGNDEAQRIIGEMCYNGQGMKRNVAASFKWNELAAEGGNKIAQYNLGYLYEKGEGVSASNAQAVDWYTRAALQGYPAAQHKLGDLYSISNQDKAIYWYDQARLSGDEQASRKYSLLSSERGNQRRALENILLAEEKERRRIKERQEADDDRREKNRRAAQEAEDRQSTREYNAAIGAQILQGAAENAALLNKIDRQTNAAIRDSNRVLAAQAAERDRARAEREDREANRRRDAERERAARAEAERLSARARTAESQPELPKYQPQVVTIPSGRQTCPPGSSPARQASGEHVTIPPTAYCVKDPQSVATNGTALRQTTANNSSAANDNRLVASTSKAEMSDSSSSNAKKKERTIEWGPVQLEAIAICRQSEKSGKWECNGALDNQTIVDEPTLESALARQYCSGGTWAAGGPTIKGVQWDAYHCGHALGAGDYDVAKKHGLITARRSYMCPKNQPSDGRCATFYDGQDKR